MAAALYRSPQFVRGGHDDVHTQFRQVRCETCYNEQDVLWCGVASFVCMCVHFSLLYNQLRRPNKKFYGLTKLYALVILMSSTL